jgi:geranylgeranyl diphosphate synthase type II
VTGDEARHSKRLERFRLMVDRKLAAHFRAGRAGDLRTASRYVMAGGGKRVRSALVLLSCEAAGGKPEAAVNAGAAIELMHNFTLVHDDIMDRSRARRGRPTVHVAWDMNTALLVGDILIGHAYELLLKSTPAAVPRLSAAFTRGLVEVCEGQAMDLEFNGRDTVRARDYFTMIELKTASLLSLSCEIGGLLGGATPGTLRALRRFGRYVGRAFQLQDDLLDVIADQKELGKPVGGDIIEGKRTYLLLTALGRAQGDDLALLRSVMKAGGRHAARRMSRRALTRRVADIYRRTGVLRDTERLVRSNTRRAIGALESLSPSQARTTLRWMAERLVQRAS